jgi:uncharacterized membrane protein YkoI
MTHSIHPSKPANRRLLTAIAVLGSLFWLASAHAYTGQELATQAKVTIEHAREIALKAHPGKITDQELENESGGTGLRYSFDILSAKVTQEVGVDAMTGKLLENKAEGTNPD